MKRALSTKTITIVISIVASLVIALIMSPMFFHFSTDRYGRYEDNGIFGCTSTAIDPKTGTVFVATPATGRGDIYQLSLHDRSIKRVITSPATEYAPVVSPDRTHIAFARRNESGRTSLCVYEIETGIESVLVDQNWDDLPVAFSEDNRFLILKRPKATGGLGKNVESYLIELATRSETYVGANAVFDYDGHHCLFVEKTGRRLQLIEFDVATHVRRTIGHGFAAFPVNAERLIAIVNGEVKLLTRAGVEIRTFAEFKDAYPLSVTNGFVAGIQQTSTHRLIIQDVTDDDSNVIRPAMPFSESTVTMLDGSADGFVLVLVYLENTRRRESLCVCRPPFEKVEIVMSLTDLEWE